MRAAISTVNESDAVNPFFSTKRLLLAPFVNDAREASRLASCRDKLHQIALPLQNLPP